MLWIGCFLVLALQKPIIGALLFFSVGIVQRLFNILYYIIVLGDCTLVCNTKKLPMNVTLMLKSVEETLWYYHSNKTFGKNFSEYCLGIYKLIKAILNFCEFFSFDYYIIYRSKRV